MLGGRSRFASRRLLAASTQSRAVDAKNDSFAFGLMQGLLILQLILVTFYDLKVNISLHHI